MVRKKFCIAVILILLIVAGAFVFFFRFNEDSFSVKTFLVKSTIPLGGESSYEINIENLEDVEQEFKIYFENIGDIVFVEEDNFIIGSNEKKEIPIFIKDENLNVNVYTGELIIEGISTKKIPVVITVEDDKNLLSIIYSIVPSYYELYPGGKLGLDIKLYDLNDLVVPSIKASSYIQNINGEILWTNEQDLIVNGIKTEVINLPKNWLKGEYVFVTLVDYKGVKSISHHLFSLSNKEYNLLQNFNAKLLISIALIFILGFILLFFYLLKLRDEFLILLKKQQKEELNKNVRLIKCSAKEIKESKKNPVKKKKRIKQLRKLKKKIIHRIKKKQAIQREQLRKLKKKNKKRKVQNILKAWKSQGYKMSEAKEEFNKNLSFKKQIKKWKSQGYKK